MSFVTTAPDLVTAAAADLAKVGSAVSAANAAAKTTGVLRNHLSGRQQRVGDSAGWHSAA